MDLVHLQNHADTIISVAQIIVGGISVLVLLMAISSIAHHWYEKRQLKIDRKATIGVIIVLLAFCALGWGRYTLSTWVPSIPNSPYVAIARANAQTAGIDPELYIRQINRESGFNPRAFSSAGAEGIAQFMPDTAANLGIDPWNPKQSLQAAAYYMATLLENYNHDYAKALAAYNAGQGTVDQCLQYGSNWLSYMPDETQKYVHAILIK